MATEKTGADKMQNAGARSLTGPHRLAVELRQLIVDGAYKAGARVTERTVSERFGCSAAATREAFHLLEKQGAIAVSARRGARVIDEKQAPPVEIFLVWDRLRWLLGEELRRQGETVNGDTPKASSGRSRSERLSSAEASLVRLGALAHNRRLAEAMARIALHVMIVAPGRFDEIEVSLAR